MGHHTVTYIQGTSCLLRYAAMYGFGMSQLALLFARSRLHRHVPKLALLQADCRRFSHDKRTQTLSHVA